MRTGSPRAAAVLALLGACGRVGYEPVTTDAPTDVAPDVGPAPCPLAMVPICDGASVCIDLAERGYTDWTNARDLCAVTGARLCTDAEWAEACTCAVGLIDMAGDGGGTALEWEWLAEETGGIAQKRGYAACSDTSTHPITDSYDYRCCADR